MPLDAAHRATTHPARFALVQLVLLLLLSIGLTPTIEAQPRTDQVLRRNIMSGGLNQDIGTYLIVEYAPGRTLPGGSSAPKGKPDHILVGSFRWEGEANPEGGKASLGHLQVTKSVGESTTVLLEALDQQQVLPKVDLVVYRTVDEKKIEEMRITLEDVEVVSVQTQLKKGNIRMPGATMVEEVVHFSYSAITWTLEDGTSSYRAER
jgi:type VI secretion system Hcp family effector